MNISPQTPRLNVNLKGNDPQLLTKLRDKFEKRESRRLTWAEVVRMLIHQQAKAEGLLK